MEQNKPIYNEEEIKPPNNEQQLNNPSTDEPLVPAAETSAIINTPSDIKEMEVHHHAHDPAAPHHKKNWKSYFWEFLMLFLAVSLGFYAENTREVILHKKEVKTQLNSMLSDLQADIILFDSVTDRNSYGAQMADSLIEMLHSNNKNTTEIYFAARTVTANLGYYYTNSKSFDQLKTAGLLRYIKSKELLDSIGAYYVSFQWLANQIDLLRLKMDEIHRGNALLFDGYVFQQMISTRITGATTLGGQRTTLTKPAMKPELLSTDAKDINTVSLNYHYYTATIKFYVRMGNALQNRAKRLIQMINKEYSFNSNTD
ncbi:MAG: hypothetical protein K2Q24_06125 [Chitinophagaceae bacterium]|jgi:hypothetical protein|nr:hypothetical protein [Chitinophagaceae bacterium]